MSINGIETAEFLSSFAAQNSLGLLEPHADWNQVMSSPAGDIQGLLSSFEGSSPFYPGENITFNFENKSTTFPLPWLATYFAPADIPLISSGKDFYTYFVLGENLEETELPPPDSNPTLSTSTLEAPVVTATELSNTESAATTASASSATPPPSWDYFPYPADPSIVQPDLGNLNGGVVTGYLLNDGTTAVLSIPSFDVTGEAILSFSNTIAEFIRKSKEGGYKRVIIDVQRNGGAGHLLATDTFKQVSIPVRFPSKSDRAFSSSRPLIHLMGAGSVLTEQLIHWAIHLLHTSILSIQTTLFMMS